MKMFMFAVPALALSSFLVSGVTDASAATSEQNLERCARHMARPNSSQSQIKGLKMFADKFNCWSHFLEIDKRSEMAEMVRRERWYQFKIDRHRRLKRDNRAKFYLLIIEWDYRKKADECEFGIFQVDLGRTRIGRPFERHVNNLGWKEGMRRFSAARQKHRNYTWQDTAKWIMVATADYMVPNYCDLAPRNWNWSSIYRSGSKR